VLSTDLKIKDLEAKETADEVGLDNNQKNNVDPANAAFYKKQLSDLDTKNLMRDRKARRYLVAVCKPGSGAALAIDGKDSAFAMWEALKDEFATTSNNTKMDLDDELAELVMEASENPRDFANRMLAINNKLRKIDPKFIKSDTELVSQFFRRLRKTDVDTWKTYVQINEKGMASKKLAVWVKDAEETFDKFIATATAGTDGALAANNVDTTFKGTCNWCGFKNHKEADCRKKKAGQPKTAKTAGSRRPNGGGGKGKWTGKPRACHHCKATDHLIRDCPKKKADSGGGGGSGAIDNLFVGTIKFPLDLTDAYEQRVFSCSHCTPCMHTSALCHSVRTPPAQFDINRFQALAYDSSDDDDEDTVHSDTDSLPPLHVYHVGPIDWSSRRNPKQRIVLDSGAPLHVVNEDDDSTDSLSLPDLIPRDDQADSDDDDSTQPPPLMAHGATAADSDDDSTLSNVAGVTTDSWEQLDDSDDDSLELPTVELLDTMQIGASTFHATEDDYLVDFGAKANMIKTDHLLYNQRTPTVPNAKVATGAITKISKMGEFRLQPDGESFIFEVKQANHLPELTRNLLSLSALIEDDWEPTFTKTALMLSKQLGHRTITITCRRAVDGMYYLKGTRVPRDGSLSTNNIEPPEQGGSVDGDWHPVAPANLDQDGAPKATKAAPQKKISADEAHDKLGHMGAALLKRSCKHHGLELQGSLSSCDACALTKAKQRGVSKTTETKATKPGQRVFLDCSGPFPESVGGNQYQAQAVDDATHEGFVGFLKRRSQLCQWFEDHVIIPLTGMDKKIEFLRCDNAGENVVPLQKLADKYGFTLELTAPNTPQMNGVVERRIPVLTQKGHAMMLAARFTKDAKEKLWAESVNHANDLFNITMNTTKDKPPEELFTGTKSKRYPYLVEFGRVGYVTIRKKIRKKWTERSFKAVHVGFAKGRPADTYKFYNPATGKMFTSRDVPWSDWSRPDSYEGLEAVFEAHPDLQTAPPGIDDQDGPETVHVAGEPHLIPADDDSASAAGRNTAAGAAVTANANANAVANTNQAHQVPLDDSSSVEGPQTGMRTRSRAAQEARLETLEDTNDADGTVHFVFNTELASDYGEPDSYDEAVTGPEESQWRKASIDEVNNFIKRCSWQKVSRKVAKREGRKIVHTKWVYKKKDEPDGSVRYKGRIVTKGFMQTPGVDYTESFAPVVIPTSMRAGFGIALYKGWDIEVIDIEAVFLEGDLTRPMFIEFPDGMVDMGFISEKEQEESCILLVKGMYGNVAAALTFFIEYVNWLTNKDGMAMQQCKTDPCVFLKFDDDGDLVLIAMAHVDDTALCGFKKWILWFKKGISGRFGYKDQGQITKHLGIWYEFKTDKNGERYFVTTAPKLVDEIIETYEKHVGRAAKAFDTPGSPNVTLSKHEGEPLDVTPYRSIVGKFMYLVTKNFPEGVNVTRELTRHFSNPGEEHWKELGRVVGYLKSHKEEILVTFRKPKELRVTGNVDTNYATNADDRKSITGMYHTLGGMLISWMSKGQSSVCLSVTEAEYMGCTTAVQELVFVQSLLDEMTVLKKPGLILEDNMGAIFLVKNQSVGQRTKHIDIRAHWLREHYAKSAFEILHCAGDSNESDIATKSTTVPIHVKHATNIRNGTMFVRENWSSLMDQVRVASEARGTSKKDATQGVGITHGQIDTKWPRIESG